MQKISFTHEQMKILRKAIVLYQQYVTHNPHMTPALKTRDARRLAEAAKITAKLERAVQEEREEEHRSGAGPTSV